MRGKNQFIEKHDAFRLSFRAKNEKLAPNIRKARLIAESLWRKPKFYLYFDPLTKLNIRKILKKDLRSLQPFRGCCFVNNFL